MYMRNTYYCIALLYSAQVRTSHRNTCVKYAHAIRNSYQLINAFYSLKIAIIKFVAKIKFSTCENLQLSNCANTYSHRIEFHLFTCNKLFYAIFSILIMSDTKWLKFMPTTLKVNNPCIFFGFLQ